MWYNKELKSVAGKDYVTEVRRSPGKTYTKNIEVSYTLSHAGMRLFNAYYLYSMRKRGAKPRLRTIDVDQKRFILDVHFGLYINTFQ